MEPVVIEGRESMIRLNILQCIAALSIEVNTGMRHSGGSVLRLTQERYGVKSRTKAKALQELRGIYHDRYGEWPKVGSR